MQRKTTILESTVGTQTTGVLPIDRIPGIVPEARQQLTIRDLLYQQSTTQALVDVVKVIPPNPAIASPVSEGSVKPENQFTFASISEKVRLLSTWIPASKQVLDDMQDLMAFINSTLPYYVNLCEEQQLLSGDGTGENLHGLVPQAAAFNKSGLPPNSSRIDYIGYALAQVTAAKELTPSWVVVHPSDWFSMRLQKDSLGRYILGDPASVVTPSLFGLQVAYTTSIAQGSFLVGSGSPIASEIRDRMQMQVEISTEHSDYFTRNLVAIRAEKRLCLIVKRPASYIVGSFSGTSPA
jgi:HK97 family phage major capsid protein